MNKLSSEMTRALEIAKNNGGTLQRYPGGFWAQPGWKHTKGVFDWVGSTTVQALVKRGAATVTQRQGATGYWLAVSI